MFIKCITFYVNTRRKKMTEKCDREKTSPYRCILSEPITRLKINLSCLGRRTMRKTCQISCIKSMMVFI